MLGSLGRTPEDLGCGTAKKPTSRVRLSGRRFEDEFRVEYLAMMLSALSLGALKVPALVSQAKARVQRLFRNDRMEDFW